MARGEAGVEPERVESKTQALNAKLHGVVHQKTEHGRVQVQVKVTIDVIKRQSGQPEFVKLGVDFRAQLFAQAVPKKITEPSLYRTIGELLVAIDQSGNVLRQQCGMAAD